MTDSLLHHAKKLLLHRLRDCVVVLMKRFVCSPAAMGWLSLLHAGSRRWVSLPLTAKVRQSAKHWEAWRLI
jgi:hypothetical protein